MDPVDPDTVTPDPPPAAEPRRIPFLAISIALVAVMAGSALFLSGYSLVGGDHFQIFKFPRATR